MTSGSVITRSITNWETLPLAAQILPDAKGCASQSQSPAALDALASLATSRRKVAPATAYRVAMWLNVIPIIHLIVLFLPIAH